jgi:Rad3-related DNA helicase
MEYQNMAAAAIVCFSGRQQRIGRYMHLDASKFMKELADEAHAIVLCGGTMSPVSSTHALLFFVS